jgi:predicted dehydrogenase
MGGRARTIGDIGSHWCDLAEFVAGSRITAVFAELLLWLPKRRKPTVHVDAFAGVGLRPDQAVEVEVTTEDCGLILLRFENGARGSCLLTQMAAGHKNALSMEVNGSEGSLRWDLERPNELWLGHRDGPNQVMAKDPALLSPDARPYAHFPGHHNEGYPDTFKNLFEPVYQAIREGSGMPADPSWPTFETGYRANLVVDAILRSAQEQRWVTVA